MHAGQLKQLFKINNKTNSVNLSWASFSGILA